MQRFLLLVCCFLGGSAGLLASEPEPVELDESEIEFFEKKIRPLLVNHCYECHSAKADELRGNLAVDTRAGLREGGDNGPAVTPGDVEDSFLLRVIRYQEDDYQMPPAGRLPEAAIKVLEKWIEMGAPDPRVDTKPRQPTRPTTHLTVQGGAVFASISSRRIRASRTGNR